MSESSPSRQFVKRASFDRPELVGARWWHEGLRLAQAPDARNRSLRQLALAAGVVGVVGLAIPFALTTCSDRDSRIGFERTVTSREFDASAITRQSIAAQRADGWNVGALDAAPTYPDATNLDATGAIWAAASAEGMAPDLAPRRADLAPWYVTTLFQSPELPANAALRAGLKPISSPAMREAFGRGEALRTLFEGAGSASDVAIVADLPGPESVAFAAGLAPRFDPVFTFDNWPHPRGVVPAHLTLAAAAHYRRWFALHRAADQAPALFVLDRNRLNPYVDAADRFDNRYLARLPSAEQFRALGAKHLLYVVPAGVPAQELDDLNEDFVALQAAGIDVKVLSLGDLRAADATSASAQPAGRAYHYGGHPATHWWFWHHYGWGRPPANVVSTEPASVSRGYGYAAAPRRTLFSSGLPQGSSGGARPQPRGFGTTTFHTTASSGTPGRSGSYGRSGGSYSG